MKLRGMLSLLLLGLALSAGLRAEERVIVEQAGGVLPLEGERRLSIEGVFGSVRVRPGKPGELRFLSTPADDPRGELPIPLRSDGSSLILRSPE